MCELDSVDAAFSWYGGTKTTVSLIKFQLYKKSGKKNQSMTFTTQIVEICLTKTMVSL